MSVKMLSTAAQLYKKSHLKGLHLDFWRWLNAIRHACIRWLKYYFLLVVYSKNDSIWPVSERLQHLQCMWLAVILRRLSFWKI